MLEWEEDEPEKAVEGHLVHMVHFNQPYWVWELFCLIGGGCFCSDFRGRGSHG